jgi:Asparagine synthase (glutamine-hydrolyzing)
MCGIAGLIHRGKNSTVGSEMTQMLQALKHRGPDSTGYAVYGEAASGLVMRLKIAEADDMDRGRGIFAELDRRIGAVDNIMSEHGVKVSKKEKVTDYAFRYEFAFNEDLGKLAEHIEEVEGAEILSIGKGLELIKDLEMQRLSLKLTDGDI